MNDAKQCPWCQRWCLKDNGCNYIFSCGLEKKRFVVGAGCGKTWCWGCGKKFCGQYHDPVLGVKVIGAKDHHDTCCSLEEGFVKDDYCAGGCSSHCGKRW